MCLAMMTRQALPKALRLDLEPQFRGRRVFIGPHPSGLAANGAAAAIAGHFVDVRSGGNAAFLDSTSNRSRNGRYEGWRTLHPCGFVRARKPAVAENPNSST